ncbi:MAG: peptidylprolyl isomerase [Flavobacterium sp.]|nr:peptidylprolyl isomerase [Flavobacterium sp.]
MAVLSKIRQRSMLLIGVIGFCLFAFIIGDLFHSNLFSGQTRTVGSVNGEKITIEDFRQKVDNVEKSGQQISATQAVNNVWNQEVSIALVKAEFEKLGIMASEDMVMDNLKQVLGLDQDPKFQTAGKFDKVKFEEFLKGNPEAKQAVELRKKDAQLSAQFQVYSSLIKAGSYTTTGEAKLKYEMETDKVTFDYVAVAYSTIKDSDVKVSDDEILAYMKKDEKKYKAEEMREVDYVVVEEKASKADEDAVKNEVNALLTSHAESNNGVVDTVPSFKSASNVADFVNKNSDSDRPFDSTYVAKNQLPVQFAEQLFNLPTGEVFGPYMDGQYYCLTKSLGRKAGVNARASHILLAYKGAMRANPAVTRTKEEAAAKANELLAQINTNPDSFMMLALTNSDDGSKQQGGDLGFFTKGKMTPKFEDFVFNNPVGKVGLVETEFGYHIIKVTEKQDAIKLATIARKIQPSDATTNDIYTKASKFEQDAEKKSFEAVAKENKLTISPAAKVKAMDESFGTVGAQRQIVKWAFDKETNVGDIKKFDVVNVGHVIAKLKKINPEGLTPIADARLAIEPILKNKKKAEMIKAKMKGATLEAIATSNATTVATATDLTLESAVLPTGGQEQRVVGTAFAIGVNKVSAPIDGATGVFVVRTKSVTKAPAITDYKDYVSKMNAQNASAAGRVLEALKSNAEIEDNRKMFY